MERRVFISFLGTSNYVECVYDVEGTKSKPVRFVQEALIQHYCMNWTENDRIFVFCTRGERGSRILNWEDNGHKGEKVLDIEKIGLCKRLEGLRENGLKVPFEAIDIDDGLSEKEIWNIFNIVYNNLKEGDHVFFDVTHAFRSIPLFSTVLFNHARTMMSINVETIQYGAFEKLGPANKVKETIPVVEERVVSVINLTNVIRLQEYNQIADALVNFGMAKKVASIVDVPNSSLADVFCNAVSDLDDYINLCRLKDIREGKFIIGFRQNLRNIKKGTPVPIQNILSRLNDETSNFVESKNNKNIEAAILWAKKYDMLVQAYTMTLEYVILCVSEAYFPEGLKNKYLNDFKQCVSDVMGMGLESFEQKDTSKIYARIEGLSCSPKSKELLKNAVLPLFDKEIVKEFRINYDELRKRRNSLAHGKGEYTFDRLKDDFPSIYDSSISILKHYFGEALYEDKK